jgi:hypothetical protein
MWLLIRSRFELILQSDCQVNEIETEKTDSESSLEMFPEIDAESLMQNKEHAYDSDDQEITQCVAVQSKSSNHC